MTLRGINISKVLGDAKQTVEQDQKLEASTRTLINLLITIIELICDKLGVSSKTGNVSPSQDPYRKKEKKQSSVKRPGGQLGHAPSNLQKVARPDRTEHLKIDRRKLPRHKKYRKGVPEIRQTIEIIISKEVVEYRAEVLIDEDGNKYVAEFPFGVEQEVQYGSSVKAQICYLSTYQMIPYARIESDLREKADINISQGTISNTLQVAYNELEPFEAFVKKQLIESEVVNFDETGININGKNHWVHEACNEKWTLLVPHCKRGQEAIDAIGVLPNYKGIAVHDHFKAYFAYKCAHALCNAHHLRELDWVTDNTASLWADKTKSFLLELNANRDANLENSDYLKRYKALLALASEECPQLANSRKQSKERNLIKRLTNFETETLRFVDNPLVPFTNNQAERDFRMTKVHQKVSGCFRSFEGAKAFCRIKSFISTCAKNNLTTTDALKLLFQGKLHSIIQKLQL